MSVDPNKIKFPVILNGVIQDVSNALGILSSAIDTAQFNDGNVDAARSDLQYEISRVHQDILQAQQLYEIKYNAYCPQFDEHLVFDLLEDIDMRVQALADARDIKLSIDCDESLIGVFDANLLETTLCKVAANACRYAKTAVCLKAECTDEYLIIRIMDDSRGYPDRLHLDASSVSDDETLTFSACHALTVVQLHGSEENPGFIEINNKGLANGGCYSVYLPYSTTDPD